MKTITAITASYLSSDILYKLYNDKLDHMLDGKVPTILLSEILVKLCRQELSLENPLRKIDEIAKPLRS